MVLPPQMASPLPNRRANNSPNPVARSNRSSWARTLLVEAARRSFSRETPHHITESGHQVDARHLGSRKASIIDLTESPIASQACASRRQPSESTHERSTNNCKNNKRERSQDLFRKGVSIAATPETLQDSEPVRPAKRRRTIQSIEQPYRTASSPPIHPAKRRERRDFVDAPAEFPTYKEEGLLLSQKDEIEDSYEKIRVLESSPFALLVVEIPIYEDFDRDAYAKVSVSSSQSVSIIPLQKPLHIPQQEQDSSPSQFGDITIPDSQDFLDGFSTKSLERDLTRRLSDSPAGTRNPTGSNAEDKDPVIQISSPAHISPATCLVQPAPSVGQNSGLSFTEVWQGAQTVPLLDLSARLDFEIFQDGIKFHSGASQQEHSQNASTNSVLSQRDANSQPSSSETQGSKGAIWGSQANSRHTQPPITENVGPRADTENCTEGESYTSPQRPSSPPLNPPHCLDTSDSNLPQRPNTPSDYEMTESAATSASSKMSYKELAMQARDKVRARYEVPQAVTNIAQLSSSPVPNMSHQMLPVRENVAGMPPPPPMRDNPDDDDQVSESGEVTLSLPLLEPKDLVILLPLASMVRNVYKATITNRKREIVAFLNSYEMDLLVMKQMDTMVEELKMLTDHQDLITDMSLTQSAVPDEHQAKWAETCSTKCLFLRYFLDQLRLEEKHIAILARPGRMLDILESILKVHGFIYERPDRPSRSNNRAVGPLRITLLPTGLNGGQYVVNRADAVVAFDETSRVSERYSKVLRTHLYEPGKLSPLISLVVAYSAEHIELCLPKLADPVERMICLIDFIVQKRDKLGDLDEGLPLPQDAAAAVGQYLRADNSTLPLLWNPEITGLTLQDSNLRKQIQSGSTTQPQAHEPLPAMTPHGATKRTLRAESISGPDIDSTKRMRMTPTRGDVASSGDVTRVSDTVGHSSQIPPASTGDTAYGAISKVDAVGEDQSRHISSLLAKVDDLEVELQNKQSTEDQLRQMVKKLEARLEDHVSTIERFQPKLLQAIADRGKFQAERDAAKAQKVILTQTIETRVTEVANLKEDKETLEKELAAARAALTNSAVPEVAKLAQAQEQMRALQIDKDRLGKRILSMQRDFEFTRDSYQKASSYTTELRNELSELKEETTILQRKASENTVRIAEVQRANEAKEREERIDELEALLRDRELELRKKTEELKIKTNGRRETRGTSVPRSPRMGSGAMSPRPHFARHAGGSRGASPAPGDVRDGFRDATLFPSSALASARWPHLSDR